MASAKKWSSDECVLQLSGFREFLVFEILGMDQFEHRVPKQERILAVVEPPRHFVKVGRQMLCRYTMPSPHDPAFEQAESGFNGVCVDVAFHVFLRLCAGLFCVCDPVRQRVSERRDT